MSVYAIALDWNWRALDWNWRESKGVNYETFEVDGIGNC